MLLSISCSRDHSTGITITSGFAIDQCARLLKTQHGAEREELEGLQARLGSKIQIIAPAIDMIELIAARGNTSLESAVSLTKSIRWEIQRLGLRLAQAAAEEEKARRGSSKARTKAQHEIEMNLIVKDIKRLLDRIEDAVPLINLAITTSGVNLSTNMSASVSPSRLLQASMFLNTGDSQYSTGATTVVQIGPTFTLSMYMLFLGHSQRAQDEEGIRTTVWQEVIHKARVKLVRVPLHRVTQFPYAPLKVTGRLSEAAKVSTDGVDRSNTDFPGQSSVDEFAYQMCIIEDLDDGRFHTDDHSQQPETVDEVRLAGIREIIPIHQVSKIFYADTGKVLNIGSDGESNNPVLLVKRDVHARPPRRMMEDEQELDDNLQTEANFQQRTIDKAGKQSSYEESGGTFKGKTKAEKCSEPWRLPPGLDPEWVAFEVYAENPSEDSDPEEEPEVIESTSRHQDSSLDHGLQSALSHLRLSSVDSTWSSTSTPDPTPSSTFHSTVKPNNSPPHVSRNNALIANATQTRLSLLEMLIRLSSLQQFQQASHLTVTDELLNYFLEDSTTTGAADEETRKRIRLEARARVGFDPYAESPVKRRGEQHAQQYYDTVEEPEEGKWDEYQRGYDEALGDLDFGRLSASRDIAQSRAKGKSDEYQCGYSDALGDLEPTRLSVGREATPLSPSLRRSRDQSSRPGGAALRKESTPLSSPPLGGDKVRYSGGYRDELKPRDESGLATPSSVGSLGIRTSRTAETRIREEVELGRRKGLGSPAVAAYESADEAD
ncbi:hypothetical protein FH972_023343 [Carpinus fangiana]|uniref:Uncharacterized protein n=1 Tax=Carpinus fangiana TaxID=176857 RepID=A0A5N6KUY1_9ROSI|nr:hypothetical protein FH972_023343 [Carpinus fangiana]